ncbi:MAG: PD-(D/E)XK nuclease family protein [Blastocatellia bacterium]
MNLPEDFVFSQSGLQDYEDCARRFELRYLLDVRWPALQTEQALQYEAGQQKGQEFHHLIHQHTLGVPAAAIEATIGDEQLRAWWDNYLRWQTEHLPEQRYSELTLTAPLAETLVMAQYDIVARIPDGGFVIVDWKTGRRQKRELLANRMQTVVYPFVLSQAGDWLNNGQPIPPDCIRLIYWFAEDGSTIEFQSSAEKLLADETLLASRINEIKTSFDFPKTDDERRCRFCVYRSLCERGVMAGDLNELDEDELANGISLDLDEIEEISF